jgi:hypothetical protein
MMLKPFITFAPDYLDFQLIQRAFKHADIDLSYEEVGCGNSEITNQMGQYHAVFFLTESKDRPRVKKFIQDWKSKFNQLPTF